MVGQEVRGELVDGLSSLWLQQSLSALQQEPVDTESVSRWQSRGGEGRGEEGKGWEERERCGEGTDRREGKGRGGEQTYM